jgi:hypothetical protein
VSEQIVFTMNALFRADLLERRADLVYSASNGWPNALNFLNKYFAAAPSSCRIKELREELLLLWGQLITISPGPVANASDLNHAALVTRASTQPAGGWRPAQFGRRARF